MANPLELKITRYINGDSITDTLNGSAITLKHTYNPKPGDGESDISETVQLVLEGLIVRDSGTSLKDQNAGIYIYPGAHLEMHVAHRVGMEIVIAREVMA